MSGCKGPITTFIVEPFVPHNEEYYLNVVSDRLGCSISFSECGGIEIEENWDKVKTIFLPTGASLTPEICAPLVATLPLEIKAEIDEFIQSHFHLFQDLDFTFLEMNPFTLVDGRPYPLDMRGELDDTAAFKNFKKWGDIEFPMPFGRVMSPTESFIHGLDEKTSASLKFTVLNPKGRIWTMVAGGGASVIYADTVCSLKESLLRESLHFFSLTSPSNSKIFLEPSFYFVFKSSRSLTKFLENSCSCKS
ncbi:hypothetical protein EUTSA_v10008114mg [Eutrema salsugineum]|nr:hypothetical protein EUTSA_v10008114mg [Eutrema salsugineum]